MRIKYIFFRVFVILSTHNQRRAAEEEKNMKYKVARDCMLEGFVSIDYKFMVMKIECFLYDQN